MMDGRNRSYGITRRPLNGVSWLKAIFRAGSGMMSEPLIFFWQAHCAYLHLLSAGMGAGQNAGLVEPLGIGQVRARTDKPPVHWFLADRVVSSGVEVFGPSALEEGVRLEKGSQVGPYAVVSGPISSGRKVALKNCLLHVEDHFDLCSDLENVWMQDHFMIAQPSHNL